MKAYGCANRPPMDAEHVLVQDGWTTDGRRNMIAIPNAFRNAACAYGESVRDLRCADCRERAAVTP